MVHSFGAGAGRNLHVGEAGRALFEALDALLWRAAKIAGNQFTGLGVIVSTGGSLPIFPIGPALELDPTIEPVSLLGAISVAESPHHDGFHILTPALEVRAISQYFSPPVVTEVQVNRATPIGGRYLAALFGSTMEGVLATGIATPTLGVIIFVSGQEVSRRQQL